GTQQIIGALAEKLVPDTSQLGQLRTEISKTQQFIAQMESELPTALFKGKLQSLIDAQKASLVKLQAQEKDLVEKAKGDEKPSGTENLIPVETDAQRKARLDATRAAIDEQLAIVNEGFEAQNAAAKRSYDQGLASLTDYYTQRTAIIKAQSDAAIK